MSDQERKMIIIIPMILLVITIFLVIASICSCSSAMNSTEGSSETQEETQSQLVQAGLFDFLDSSDSQEESQEKSQEETQKVSSCKDYQVYDISEQMKSGEMGLVILSYKSLSLYGYKSYVLVDPQTGVMYSFVNNGYSDGIAGFTVLLNPDGTPRIYQEDQD